MKKRAFLLTAMTAFILALTACGVAEKTPEGEDTGITQTENPNNDQYYVPLDTDGDGEEDQAIVVVMGTYGDNDTPEEDYTPVSEMTFEKRPEIDSDGMFMQYGPILIEFGVSSMEDIKAQIEHSGIPQWETFRENPEDESGSFCGVHPDGLGVITAGYGGELYAVFINFEEGNEWGYEPGYRAVYAMNLEPVASSDSINYVPNDYVWFSDSAAAFFEEHGDGFDRNGYNEIFVYRPIRDYYGFVPAE